MPIFGIAGGSPKNVPYETTELVLTPATPLVGEPINATLRAVWPDGCIPTLGSVHWSVTPAELPTVPRTDIYVELVDTQAGGCTAALTPFELPIPLGVVTTNDVYVQIVLPSPLSEPPLFSFQVQFTALNPIPHALSLGAARFLVQARWRLPAPGGVGGVAEGDAEPVPGASRDSGLLWFFQPDNWELMVKVLDGCAINGHYWVFGTGATNVEFDLTITDTVLSSPWTYHNPQGRLAGTFVDIEAFVCGVP
jgi:hypothetical protein